MRNLAFVGLSALVAWSVGVGCSGSDGATAKKVELSGMYTATSAGAISTITFYDPVHYFLWRTCSAGSCLEHGTFVLNEPQTLLSLASVETGETTTLSFDALQVSTALTSESMHTLGGVSLYGDGGALASDGAALTGEGGALTGDAGAIVVQVNIALTFNLGAQGFGDTDGGGGDDGGGGNNGNGNGGNDSGSTADASGDSGQLLPTKGACGTAVTQWGTALDNNTPGKSPCTVISTDGQTELNACFNNGSTTQGSHSVASLACLSHGQFAYACVPKASNFCHDKTYGP